MDALDAIDPFVAKPAAPDPAELTEQEKAEIIARRDAAAKPVQDAQDALVAAVADFEKAPTPEARATVHCAVQAAEELGVKVNRAALVALGALDTQPEPDVDEVIAPEPVEEPEPEPVVMVDVDPLVLVPGMVPLYNPLPVPMAIPWGGQRQIVRAQGIDLVDVRGADIAVGPDNAGGHLSRLGLRRLYGPEPRFAEAIAKSGLTPEAWCKKRNDALIFVADGIGEKRAVELAKEVE